MEPILKHYGSPDADLRTFAPEGNFELLLELEIGLSGDSKSDLFQVVISTPRCADDFELEDLPALRKGYIIVDQYDLNAVIDKLNHFISECSGHTWLEIARKLSSKFFWEYEHEDAARHSWFIAKKIV